LEGFPQRAALKQGDSPQACFSIKWSAWIRMKLQAWDSQSILQNPQRFLPGIGNTGLSQRIHRPTV
jgi:hypothetical protein